MAKRRTRRDVYESVFEVVGPDSSNRGVIVRDVLVESMPRVLLHASIRAHEIATLIRPGNTFYGSCYADEWFSKEPTISLWGKVQAVEAERYCTCLIPTLEGAGQHGAWCALFKREFKKENT